MRSRNEFRSPISIRLHSDGQSGLMLLFTAALWHLPNSGVRNSNAWMVLLLTPNFPSIPADWKGSITKSKLPNAMLTVSVILISFSRIFGSFRYLQGLYTKIYEEPKFFAEA